MQDRDASIPVSQSPVSQPVDVAARHDTGIGEINAAPPDGPATGNVTTPPRDASSTPSAGSGADGFPARGAARTNTTDPGLDVSATGNVPGRQSTAFRFLLLGPDAPWLIEIRASVAGRPLGDILAEAVQAVLAAADENHDGRPTWDEVLAGRRFQFGQYGNFPFSTPASKMQIRQQYDIDGDNLVDPNEVPRFVTRNAGGAAVFSLRGSNLHRGRNKYGAPLWVVLDGDDDGRLSPQEIAAAADKVRARDIGEDELIYPGELSDDPRLPESGLMHRRRYGGPDRGMALNRLVNWDRLHYDLGEMYGMGVRLSEARLAGSPAWLPSVDADADGIIGPGELPGLLSSPPDLTFALAFEPPSTQSEPMAEAGPATLVLSGPPPHGTTCTPSASTLVLRAPRFQVQFFVNDHLAPQPEEEARQIVAAFDTDKNGYLSREELENGPLPTPVPFDGYDENGNGIVDAQEIITWNRRQRLALAGQVHARVADVPDALFFVLDANHDGRLDARELRDLVPRLQALDHNVDGHVDAEEVPDAILIGFARGDMSRGDALFAPPRVAAEGPPATGPRWFRFMDWNRDGVVSPSEFPGPLVTFQSLDVDGDGFLTEDEAARAGNAPR